jgi:hypothetical protein
MDWTFEIFLSGIVELRQKHRAGVLEVWFVLEN